MAAQTNESLRSLTLEVIENYRKAARSATRAWRTTSSRGVDTVNSAISKSQGKLSDTVEGTLDMTKESILAATSKADQALDKLGDSVKDTPTSTQKTLNNVADKTDSAVDRLLTGTSKRVAKFPAKGGKLGGLLKNKRLQSVESLGVPGAKLLCYVSGKLADTAEQVSNKLAGEKTTKRVAAKKTAKAVKSVRKPAAKVAKAVKTAARRPAAKKTVARKAAPAHSAVAA